MISSNVWLRISITCTLATIACTIPPRTSGDFTRGELAHGTATVTIGAVPFETTRALLPEVRLDLMERFPFLRTLDRPLQIRSRPQPVSAQPHFELFNNVSIQARWLEIGSATFYFLSKRTESTKRPKGPDGRYRGPVHRYQLAFVDPDRPDRDVQIVGDFEMVGAGLTYEVVPLPGNRVLIVNTSSAGLEQRVGRLEDDRLTFGPARPVDELCFPIRPDHTMRSAPQLHSEGTRVHLLWRQIEGLCYLNSDDPERGWQNTRVIAKKGHRAELDVRDGKVLLAWTDDRFSYQDWDLRPRRGKLFLMQSRDGGETFDRPVLHTDPKTKSDMMVPILLTTVDDRPVLFFHRADQSQSNRSRYNLPDPVEIGVFSEDLSTMQLAEPITGDTLGATYARRMRGVRARPSS